MKLSHHVTDAFRLTVVVLSMAVPFGCAEKPPIIVEDAVLVAFEPSGTEESWSATVFGQQFFAELLAEKALEAALPHYGLHASAGDLLLMTESKEPSYYIYQGNEAQPLRFLRQGPVILLNGRAVWLDLGDEEAAAWLDEASVPELTSLRGLRLSGSPELDLAALSKLQCSGILVASQEAYPPDRRPAVAQAIIAAEASALILPKPEGFENLIESLPTLSHLVWGGPRIPPLGRFTELVFYGHEFADSTNADLHPLTDAPRLRSLVLINCKTVADFSVISKLGELEYLYIDEADHLPDLSPLAGSRNLRTLVLADCDKLTDISAIGQLKRLDQLMLLPSAQIKDLSPLAKLRGLDVLLVEDKDLEARRTEYDALQVKLPRTHIGGVCMGSAWIVPVAVLGVVGGALRRRFAPPARPIP